MYEEYSYTLAQKYPNLRLVGENHPPPPVRAYLAQALNFIKLLLIGCLIGDTNPFQMIASLFVRNVRTTGTRRTNQEQNGSSESASQGESAGENGQSIQNGENGDSSHNEQNGQSDQAGESPPVEAQADASASDYTPSIWLWALENKIYASMMLFFVANFIEGNLVSTGAFEVFYNSKFTSVSAVFICEYHLVLICCGCLCRHQSVVQVGQRTASIAARGAADR